MRNLPLILFVLAFSGTLRAEDLLPVAIDTEGVSECINTCLSGLFYSITELIHLQNPVERFGGLCRTYYNASSCIENQKEICVQTTIFEIALSGLDELCNEKEEDLAPHKECLRQHSELVLKSCDRYCQITDVLSDFSAQGNSEKMQKLQDDGEKLNKQTSAVCTAFGCMSSCVALDLNIHCPPTGTIIMQALLKPFYTAAIIFEELGPRSKLSIYQQVPPQCYYLINMEDIQGIPKGKPPSKTLAKDPEDAILKEIKFKEQVRKQKKADLEKQFLMEAHQGM